MRPEPEATRRRGTTECRRRGSGGSQRLELAGTGQRADQMQERGQDVGAALVADRQAPVGQQPGQRPLDLAEEDGAGQRTSPTVIARRAQWQAHGRGGSQTEVLQPLRGKDIDQQKIVDLRRMLTQAGFAPGD
jgi:hypothetical protein